MFNILIIAAFSLISILQGIFFAVEGSLTIHNVVAICASTGTLLISAFYVRTRDRRLLWLAVVLIGVQAGIFVINFVSAVPPFQFRLLQVAIVLFYLATVTVALLVGTRLIMPSHAVLMVASIVLSLIFAETLGEIWMSRSESNIARASVEWSGIVPSHPILGQYYLPYSVLKTYYPENPRGYFKEEDLRVRMWRLQLNTGSFAILEFPSESPQMLRIAVKKATTRNPWDIQLNQERLSVEKQYRYAVVFKARADGPRRIAVAVSKGHAPWDGLGLYQEIELTSQWQLFHIEFAATASDQNARIHFDVGGSDVPVELEKVTLRGLPDGRAIEPELPNKKFFVSYRFNALGCRGQDYPIPRPNGSVRILLLGDSFTLGVGVHEDDTFARRLDLLLNDRRTVGTSGQNYEVINCGVSGYGTREERLFYELFASRYQPTIVILVMVCNDDRSWVDDVKMGYSNRELGKLEHLFRVWSLIQQYRHERPFPDFSGSLTEIFHLNNDLRKAGARLGVVIFRNIPGSKESINILGSKEFDHLTHTITEGLQGTEIPVLDLGPALFANHSWDGLLVYREGFLDPHPNEIAHSIAAREIMKVLKDQGLLKPW